MITSKCRKMFTHCPSDRATFDVSSTGHLSGNNWLGGWEARVYAFFWVAQKMGHKFYLRDKKFLKTLKKAVVCIKPYWIKC